MKNKGAIPNRRILVVDDNLAIHEDFKKVLVRVVEEVDEFERKAFGKTDEHFDENPFDVEFASQGQQALEMVRLALAEKHPFAMAFMDVRMPPGWDGVETTAKIWAVDPDLQIVICTAYSDYSWDDMMSKLGRSDQLVILKKPFDGVEVLQLANALTEKWRLLQQTRLTVADLEQTVGERTRELQASHAEVETLLASITAAIIGLDAEQKVTRWNRAAEILFGMHVAQTLGRPVASLDWKLDWKQVGRALDECRACNGPVELSSVPYRRADGKDGFINLTLTPNQSNDNPRLAVILLGADITQHQMLEGQLRQAQKLEAIGQLASGIAHEINTPTQFVSDNTHFVQQSFEIIQRTCSLFAELLQAAKANAVAPDLVLRIETAAETDDVDYLFKEIPEAIAQTLEGVNRISTIVRAMKFFSHPGSKERSPADLNRAIESTVTVARNEWKYVADLTLDLDPELPQVDCFVSDFNQAVLNLIVNAAHAIGDVVKANPGTKGKITVSTRRDGETAEVRVSDTGCGIPEEIRPKIFEPFFTTKGLGKGTGQGLSVVYAAIVKRHGGTVKFESAPGGGTVFILRIPILRGATVSAGNE